MDLQIVSSTDVQRNFKKISRMDEDIMVLQDSRPIKAMIHWEEYKRLKSLEKDYLRDKFDRMMAEVHVRNAKFSEKEIDRDVNAAIKYVRARRRHKRSV